MSPSDRADGSETPGTSFGAVEPFTMEEQARLAPYFTNIDLFLYLSTHTKNLPNLLNLPKSLPISPIPKPGD